MSTSVKIWIVVLGFGLASSIFLAYVGRTPTTQALSLFGMLTLAIGPPQMFRLMAEHPEWRDLTAEYPEWWRNAFTALGIALMVLSSWRSFWGV